MTTGNSTLEQMVDRDIQEVKNTMGEIEKAIKDTPLEGQSSDGTEESTSQEPETYDKVAYQKGISDALAEQGRKHKAELTTLAKDKETATKLADKSAKELEAIQVERDELNTRIDEMSDGDPLSPANVKLLRDLKVREQVLKDKEAAHEEEWVSKQEVLKRVVAQEVTEVAFEVAEAYEPINGKHPAETLKSYALKRGLTTKEDIQELADTFLTKKPEPQKGAEEELVLPRIVGVGGIVKLTSERADKMSMEEYANHPETKARYK